MLEMKEVVVEKNSEATLLEGGKGKINIAIRIPVPLMAREYPDFFINVTRKHYGAVVETLASFLVDLANRDSEATILGTSELKKAIEQAHKETLRVLDLRKKLAMKPGE